MRKLEEGIGALRCAALVLVAMGGTSTAEIPQARLPEIPLVPLCSSGPRVTCVVDGDTVWLGGTKYRLEDVDTPEKGGLAEHFQEGLLAIEATKRLATILSAHPFTIEASGEQDR